MKLYRVHTKRCSVYVLAGSATEAECRLTNYLDKGDYGYSSDRIVTQIDVVADTDMYLGSSFNPAELLLLPENMQD